jgi:hypothetical protein
MHEMKGDRMGLIFDLLAECIGQPGHSPHAHPHRKILPLHEAS